MLAVVYEEFGRPPEVKEVPDPAPSAGGAVIRVAATGLCRSDWHGWMGHDPDIRTFPHVPGHELAGEVSAVGAEVERWRPGDRVTVPFVCACGRCPACAAGDQQVCERQTQPGFTHWGSYAEYVAIEHADVNLVRLPADMSFEVAAGLGCRFATAFRAVVAQGRVGAGQWVAVYGCGGVGLSAVMIAAACGARVVAVDVSSTALDLARRCGATACLRVTPDGDRAALDETDDASDGATGGTTGSTSSRALRGTTVGATGDDSGETTGGTTGGVLGGTTGRATRSTPAEAIGGTSGGARSGTTGGAAGAVIGVASGRRLAGEGDAAGTADVVRRVREITDGGAHVSLDALGSPATCVASIESLRRRGRHVQVGLLPAATALPMGRVIAQELEVVGSHGMPAHAYGPMIGMVGAGTLRPDLLITNTIGLADAPDALVALGHSFPSGVTIITPSRHA